MERLLIQDRRMKMRKIYIGLTKGGVGLTKDEN
jgi:hypothetical protein